MIYHLKCCAMKIRVWQTYPPYKNLVPEIPKLGAERSMETWVWGSLHVLILLLYGCSYELEVLDGMASCMMSCSIPVANGYLAVGQTGLKVNGSVIDVLIGIMLVRKLETLPELWCVENIVHIG